MNPNFDHDKPKKLVFQYHEPSKDLSPAHTPESKLNPGKWRFYNYDLNVVREELAKEITFAKNLTLEQFAEKEDFYALLVEHNRRQ